MATLKITLVFVGIWFVLVLFLGTTNLLLMKFGKSEYESGVILVRPEEFPGQVADALMVPAMYLVSGTLEEPNRTHFWNNRQLNTRESGLLKLGHMVHCQGILGETTVWPLFHMPIFGGWRNYVVIEPEDYPGKWYIVWKLFDGAGISILPVTGKIRVLIGPGDVLFASFARDGHQILLREIGRGRVGDGGPWRNIPLL